MTKKGKAIIPKLENILKEWKESIGIDKADNDFIENITELADNSIELNKK